MSYIVPNSNKPVRCNRCPFIDADSLNCTLMEDSYKYIELTYQHIHCPLIEIPAPHGRLIDADKFAETLKEVSIRQGYDKLFSDNILSVGDVFDAIAADLKGEGLDKYKLAPTIIEAEGET